MEVFLVMRRSDIPPSVLQQVDCWPNTSSRNQIYTPKPGQTGYVQDVRVRNGTLVGNVAAGPPAIASTDLHGLSAYLIGNIDPGAGVGTAIFTAAQADTAAASIIAIATAGSAMTVGAINAALAAVVAGSTLTAGGSTGVLTEVLSILAGEDYLIPSGTLLSSGGGNFNGRKGAMVPTTYRPLYDADGFLVSNVYGNIAKMKSTDFTYAGVTGAAIVVYSPTGAVL